MNAPVRMRVAVAVALMFLWGGVALVPQAEAERPTTHESVSKLDSPRGVTWGEFKAVHRGWSKARVHEKYDVPGRKFAEGDGILIWRYPLVPSERPGGVYAQFRLRHRDGKWHIFSQSWCQGDPQECRPGWPT